MKMNLTARRIASLSAFLLTLGITSATSAGIVPWVYDSIFGPVRYSSYGYVPYSVSYGPRPVSYAYSRSNGCSTCSTSNHAPAYYAPSTSCGCGPVVMAPACQPCGASYSPAPVSGNCLSGCDSTTPTPAASAPSKGSTKSNGFTPTNKKPVTEPSAKRPAPMPTFESPDVKTPGTEDGLGQGGRVGRSESDATTTTNEAFKPAASAGSNTEVVVPPAKKAAEVNPIDEFEKPVEFNKDNIKDKTPEAGSGAGNATDNKSEATIQRRPRPSLNLDNKIARHVEPQRTRLSLQVKVVSAQVARRVPTIHSDWTPVDSKPVGTQLAKK